MFNDPISTLKQYVDMPSGSFDREDVARVADSFAQDFESLGFKTEVFPGKKFGPTLVCRIGTGAKTLMLMGHMDTVFPRALSVPYTDNGDGTARGSGIVDMKGGVVVMLHALREALPRVDLAKHSICVVLNPDEEVGSPESGDIILAQARRSFAALSFEPGSADGRLTCSRKGVTSVLLSVKGVPGHAGAQYTQCSSAIQALCAQITRLYTLRDDEKEISFNAGLISGGTAENVVAPEASCKCEFRYFDEALKQPLMEKIIEICVDEPVPGAHTSVTFGASHPAIDINDGSRQLLDMALDIAREQGRAMYHERTGGAGDIAIAGLAHIPVLDGLGTQGTGMHTVNETGFLAPIPSQIALAAELIARLLA